MGGISGYDIRLEGLDDWTFSSLVTVLLLDWRVASPSPSPSSAPPP